MAMENSGYIDFLNTLHNYNAQNPNAYAEKSVDSNYYKNIMVDVEISNYITNILNTGNPQIIILTGHAGDGKTSIMYQVMTKLSLSIKDLKQKNEYILPNGKKCLFIKDFSEFSDAEKVNVINEAISYTKTGNYAFIVANTGPLINAYGELFCDPIEKEKAKIQLIEAMDSNEGIINEKLPHPINVINVATIDNTYFAEKFLKNIISDNLWKKCECCEKCKYCHIYSNRQLIKNNLDKVIDFLNKHYIWLIEHGKRLTIRSITEQLAFMITSGKYCNDVKSDKRAYYLFSNSFFGYEGLKIDPRALNIVAVKESFNCKYEFKRFRVDEELIVNQNLTSVFSKDANDILETKKDDWFMNNGWNEYLKRAFLFLNIITDPNMILESIEDIFSKPFNHFLAVRNGTELKTKSDALLLQDALAMIYVGSTNTSHDIPITLSRSSGIAQNVQLVTGNVSKSKIKVDRRETKDGKLNGNERYELVINIEGKSLSTVLSLQLMNYFDDLKNGIISTNIDPQLSHGIESLKAQISSIADEDEDEDIVEISVLKNDGPSPLKIDFSDNAEIKIL